MAQQPDGEFACPVLLLFRLRRLERDEFRMNRLGIPRSRRICFNMLAGEGGQHGWRELILPIFASVSLGRLSKAACRGIRLRRILASPSARRSHGSAVFARRAAPRLARWADTSRRRSGARIATG